VKTRHKRVQMRMRTWLNMAECVLWIALCRSFCNTHTHIAWFPYSIEQTLVWVYLGMVNTHYHALQSTLGQPAVEEHWDKQVSEWRPEDLTHRKRSGYIISCGEEIEIQFWRCILPLWWRGQYLASPTRKTLEISAPIYYPGKTHDQSKMQ